MIQFNPKVSATGRYRVEILPTDADGNINGPARVDVEFDNMITDLGIRNIMSSLNTNQRYCFVGTGNTPPTPTDNSLVSQVMSTQTSTVGTTRGTVAPFYTERRRAFEFAAATANHSLAEVGVGGNSNGSGLTSRALLRDAGGNVSTIQVLIGEVLRVTWYLRMYYDMGEYSGVAVIEGQEYPWTAKAVLMNSSSAYTLAAEGMGFSSNGSLLNYIAGTPTWVNVGELTQAVSGGAVTVGGWSTINRNVIVPNSLQGTFVAGLNQANLATGLNYMQFGSTDTLGGQHSGPVYGMLFSRPLMKTKDNILTVVMRYSLGRME